MTTLYAIVLPVLLLFCGLVLDMGSLELVKIRMQSAADAAAIAAEMEIERNTGNYITSAQGDASLNGFTDGVNGVSVSVVKSPTTLGNFVGRYDTVQVIISQPVTTYFVRSSNGNSFNVSASAVAMIPPCLYLLGSKSLATYTESTAGTNVSTSFSTCPIYINGNWNSSSGSNIFVAPGINVTGSSAGSNASGTIQYARYGVSSISDPLSSVSQPSFSGTCNNTSYSFTTSSTSVTLSPGNYCKGMTLGNSSNDSCSTCVTTVTLNPGLYVITGGAQWKHVNLTGTGVTLFFTSGGGASYGQFKISDNSTVTLTASTSSSGGTVPGVVVFFDRSWTNTSAQDLQLNNATIPNNLTTGDGIWYLPDSGISMVSSSWGCPNYCGMVADNLLVVNSNYYPRANFSSLSGGNPFTTQSALAQ